MSRLLKKVKRLIENPKNVSFNELDSILLGFGFNISQSKGGGSHYTYRKKDFPVIITVPFKRPHVNECYVRRVIELLNLEDWYEQNC